ncbi:MAG: hypothetical protein AAF985_17085, partial [Bacteroidota bacterium]
MKAMRFLLFFTMLLLCLNCQNQSENRPENTGGKQLANAESSRKQVTQVRFNNPDSIDWQMYEEDIADYEADWSDQLPIGSLPFPVERYDTPGNGLGNLRHTINGKQVAGNFAIVGNQAAFFNILVQTPHENPLAKREISSRNHPIYLGQGSIRHPKWTIDWTAVKAENSDGFAVVGGRVFDLSQGKTIFVFDEERQGGIDFLQIDETVA